MISAVLDTQGDHPQQQAGDRAAPSVPVPGNKTVLPLARPNPNRKRVLFVTSEIADLVKTGGLGDVRVRWGLGGPHPVQQPSALAQPFGQRAGFTA